jgi:hypothetical protein
MSLRTLCLSLTFFALSCSEDPARRPPGGGGNGQDQGVGGGGGNGDDGGGGGGGGPTCVDGQCQMACPGGGTTTLSGKVYAPNGTLPLYNAIVYIPSVPVDSFTSGVTCDRCNGQVSGNPIVQTLTGADGSFTLTNVPVGQKVPLVVQLGKWRRQVTVAIPACTSTPVAAADSRLPKNHTEGDMPQMAIATGSADPFECLLLKIGIDASEITAPTAPGRVHFFLGTSAHGTNLSPAAPSANTLYSSLANLLKYDIVILPCEGQPVDKGAATSLFVQYLDMGGRLFATHYSYDWLSYTNSPFNQIGGWNLDQFPYPSTPYPGTIDTSFPKGKAFAEWMHNVDPTVNGSFPIVDPRNDLDSVKAMYAQQWISHAGDNKVMHATFNTPLMPPKDPMGQPQYCGRVVFSDFHVSASEVNTPFFGDAIFPKDCISGEMTAQEKALTFMLFDLSSCVQPDSQGPIG